MTTKHYAFLLFLFLNITYLFGQTLDSTSTTIVDNFNAFSNSRAFDNIYIQTNKDIYETEEDLWFKAYILDAHYFLPSLRSNVLFVQLINNVSKNVVWEEKYEIENGFVYGHIYIPSDIEFGDYSLKAYSSHSFYRDFDAFYAFRKLKIIDKIDNLVTKELPSEEKQNLHDFQLFPEGGHLVSGIENTLAFKATDIKGIPVKISGRLLKNGQPLLNFESTHAGMGSFSFSPNENGNYIITLDQDPNKSYLLPKIESDGILINLIEQTANELTVLISKNNVIPEKTYLRLQVRGKVYLMATVPLKNEKVVKIQTENIPKGLAEITLFNQNLEPLSERLVYLHQDQILHIETKLDYKEYKTRDKIALQIKTTNENAEPVMANLGLSVIDKLYEDERLTKTITSHYYLTSQLRGHIYDPNFYFNSENENRKAALNLLLLTQGWRRYVWNDRHLSTLKKRDYSIITDPLKGIVYAKTKSRKKQPGKGFVMLYSGVDQSGTNFLELDKTNHFKINHEHLKLSERNYIYLKPVGDKDTEYRINIKDISADSIIKYDLLKDYYYPLNLKLKAKIEDDTPFFIYDNIQKLDKVLLKKKKSRVYRDKYMGTLDSLAKFAQPDDFCICEYNIVNCPNHCPKNTDPSSIVYSEEELLERFNLTIIKGFYGKREFYSPTYKTPSPDDDFPDYRNTLIWKPDILTDKNGEATIEFYASDIYGNFTGTIEGIGGDGLLGSEDFEFIIRK